MTATGPISHTPDYQQILEAVAAVVELEVTLVNDQLVRTAGTGVFQGQVGRSLHPDSAFGQALHSGLPIQVASPRVDSICQACGARPDCQESAHVAHPILDDGVPIGVLGFIAFTLQQRTRLLHELDRYVDFLSKISHLLSTKLKEEKTTRALLTAQGSLKAVAESMAEGLIAPDREGAVTFVNGRATAILRLTGQEAASHLSKIPGLHQAVLEVVTSGRPVSNQEVGITTASGSFAVMASIQPVRVRDQVSGTVTTLRDLGEVYDLAYRLHADQPAVGLVGIIYQSGLMERVMATARRVAGSQATVLIYGESGTGKELVARALHAGSPRKKGPFIAINCAAIPEELLESELFGYADGAFTGARKGGKPGKFELANGGTLFLDEVGDMSLRIQAKLLRVLQESEVTRVGGTWPVRLNVRILAATHQDLWAMMQRREFRADLFYRLNVIPLEIPPLRERPEDILLLVEHFRERQSRLECKPMPPFSAAATEALLRHKWPGNVRELENVVQYAATMTTGPLLDIDALPIRLRSPATEPEHAAAADGAQQAVILDERLTRLKDFERQELERGLARYGKGGKAVIQIARDLGTSRATVYRRLRDFGLISN